MAPVAQVNIETGDIIKFYKSIVSAERSFGGVGGIQKVVSGVNKSCFGYFWIYRYDLLDKDIQTMHYSGPFPESIGTKTGFKRVLDWDAIYKLHCDGYSTMDIAEEYNTSVDTANQIITSFYKKKGEIRQHPKIRAVLQLDKRTGEIIQLHNTIISAARAMGKNSAAYIQVGCNAGVVIYGYRWCYETDYPVSVSINYKRNDVLKIYIYTNNIADFVRHINNRYNLYIAKDQLDAKDMEECLNTVKDAILARRFPKGSVEKE